MKENVFVVVLRYLVSIDVIDKHRPAHLEFLESYYKKEIFIASGAQVPRTGGIILAKDVSREQLLTIIEQDPFYQYRCAEFQVFEFLPNKYLNLFGKMLKDIA